ncbi:MAG: substrate-binding domain-containing protein [Chloroflexota bacterium]
MSTDFLYHQIVDAIRRDILQGTLQPGDRLLPVREMAAHWTCTIGTVQRAYKELVEQGLLVSRPGQGTHVTAALEHRETEPLRRATLVHRAEAFLLEVLTAGYAPAEVEQAIQLALDRWRVLAREPAVRSESSLHIAGSHDLAVAYITAHFAEIAPDTIPQLSFTGSLGGLIALAEGEADLAGSHLWDEETNTYNSPFVRRLLPGRRVALLTVAHRRMGLLVPPANPGQITGLADLLRPGVRFINRQPGAGTRVWLDAQLRRLGLAPDRISGYEQEVSTHTEVARAIAEGQVDVGLGVECAALVYGLEFIPLAAERYDLVIPAEVWSRLPVQALARWLGSAEAKQKILVLGGYAIEETGKIEWLN